MNTRREVHSSYITPLRSTCKQCNNVYQNTFWTVYKRKRVFTVLCFYFDCIIFKPLMYIYLLHFPPTVQFLHRQLICQFVFNKTNFQSCSLFHDHNHFREKYVHQGRTTWYRSFTFILQMPLNHNHYYVIDCIEGILSSSKKCYYY